MKEELSKEGNRMVRKYLAILDDGNNYIDFEYFSEYRNNSKMNMGDLKSDYFMRYGRKAYDKIIWENTKTYLQND